MMLGKFILGAGFTHYKKLVNLQNQIRLKPIIRYISFISIGFQKQYSYMLSCLLIRI